MRLRPSGKDGPVCSSLISIDQYFGTAAQVWEYMALTKARVITGNSNLAEEVTALLHRKLSRPWEHALLAREVRDIRMKIELQYHTKDPWKIKYSRGGLMDLEFIAQYLQLRDGTRYPQLIDSNSSAVFRKCGELGVITSNMAEMLTEAAQFLFDLQSLLRIAYEGKLTDGVKAVLTSAMNADDFAQVEDRLLQEEKQVWEYFEQVVC